MGNTATAQPRFGKWTQVEAKNDHLFPGSYATAHATIGTRIFLFGGFDGTNDQNTLLIFHTDTFEWKKPLIVGDLPSHRAYATLTAVGSKLFLFGGFCKASASISNEMFMLDTEKPRWEWVKVLEAMDVPRGRYEHSACSIGDSLYIFGGGNATGWLNDLHVYDTALKRWKFHSPLGKKPQKRLAHAACAVDDRMYVLGGYNAAKRRLNDAHVLQTRCVSFDKDVSGENSMVWVQPQLEGNLPPERAGHTAVQLDNSILIFGGYGISSQRMSDVYLVDSKHMVCSKVNNRFAKHPVGRSYQAAGVVGRRFFILGGFDGVDVLNDVWYLDIDYLPMGDPIQVPPSTMRDTYRSLVGQERYSDIRFIMDDGTRIAAHKLILASRSAHFRAMLEGGMAESGMGEIPLPGIPTDAFQLLLQYIYSDEVDLTGDNVIDLFKLANQFNEHRLQLQCEQMIESGIDLNNVCACLHLASDLGAEHLRKASLNYLVIHHQFLKSTAAFLALPPTLRQEADDIIALNSQLARRAK